MSLRTALLLGLACLALPACRTTYDFGSGEKDEFSREGAYLGGSIVRSLEHYTSDEPDGAREEDESGWGLRAGVRWTEDIAVEITTEQVYRETIPHWSEASDLHQWTIAAQVKYFLLPGRFQPYVLGGVGRFRLDDRETGFDASSLFLRAGAGVDLYLTTWLALFAEGTWNWPTDELADYEHSDLQGGFLIRF